MEGRKRMRERSEKEKVERGDGDEEKVREGSKEMRESYGSEEGEEIGKERRK